MMTRRTYDYMSDCMIAVKALNEMMEREPENSRRLEMVADKMLAIDYAENSAPKDYWHIQYRDKDGAVADPKQIGPDILRNVAGRVARGQTAGRLSECS